MIKLSSIKFCILLLLFSFFSVKAQDSSEKWGVGLNSSSALYSTEDGLNIGGRFIPIIPGVSISKYLGKKMTGSAMFSYSLIGDQKYFASDFNLTYDIFNPDFFLRPYLLAGVGVVNLLDTSLNLNLGGGGTLWIFNNVGLNAQLMLKVSAIGGQLQGTHVFGSGGIVYSFTMSRNKRLWQK